MFKSNEALKLDAVSAHLTNFGPAPRKSLKVEIDSRFFGLVRIATVTRVK